MNKQEFKAEYGKWRALSNTKSSAAFAYIWDHRAEENPLVHKVFMNRQKVSYLWTSLKDYPYAGALNMRLPANHRGHLG